MTQVLEPYTPLQQFNTPNQGAFHPGEQLRLVISARNTLGGIFPGNDFYDGRPDGRLIIHTGGSQASYLNLPVMAT